MAIHRAGTALVAMPAERMKSLMYWQPTAMHVNGKPSIPDNEQQVGFDSPDLQYLLLFHHLPLQLAGMALLKVSIESQPFHNILH